MLLVTCWHDGDERRGIPADKMSFKIHCDYKNKEERTIIAEGFNVAYSVINSGIPTHCTVVNLQ